MTVYDEDLLKTMDDYLEMIKGDWIEELHKTSDPDQVLSQLKLKIPRLQNTLQLLLIVTKFEMSQTNKMRDILSKLPDSEEFKELKQELEIQKNNVVETLLPIKKLADNLQESKNKEINYIG